MEFIEAAFGRIKLFGGIARTVLNEHFVLKAVKAFFLLKRSSTLGPCRTSSAALDQCLGAWQYVVGSCGDVQESPSFLLYSPREQHTS